MCAGPIPTVVETTAETPPSAVALGMSVRRRLRLLIALALLTLVLPMLALLLDQQRQLSGIGQRMQALQPMHDVLVAISALQQDRGRLAQQQAFPGTGPGLAQLSEARATAEQALFAAERSLSARDAVAADAWRQALEAWPAQRDQACAATAAEDCLGPHTRLIADLLAVADGLLHRSGLLLLDDLDTRLRMEQALLRQPQQLEALGQARALGTLLLGQPQQRQLHWRLALAQMQAGCGAEMASAALVAACAEIARLLAGEVGNQPQYWATLTAAMRTRHGEIDAAIDQAIAELQQLYERQRTAHTALLTALLLLGLLAALAAISLGRSIVRPLRQTVATAEAILAGDLDLPIRTDLDGEFGRLLAALSRMREVLRSELAAERIASERARRFAQALEQSRDAIVILDRERKVVEANSAFERMTGLPLAKLRGSVFAPLCAECCADPQQLRQIESVLALRAYWQGELIAARTGGEAFPAWMSLVVTGGSYYATLRDLSEEKALRRDLARLTHTDPLTGLANRAGLFSHLERALARPEETDGRVVLFLVDVDRFMHVNDALGHIAGDALLVELAQRLRQVNCSLLARSTGDEFALVAALDNETDPLRLARRLLDCAEAPFHVGEHHLSITLSIGAAVMPGDANTATGLLADADMALHQAKADGRNTIRFFAPHMQRSSVRQLGLRNALRGALARNEVSFVLQPKACLRTGRVLGAEALLRWQHPELGLVPPDEFIPMAEDSGLIHELGEWILWQSALIAVEWQERAAHPLTVAVNLTQLQLMRPGLLELIQHALGRAAAAASVLELEITESAAMADPDYARRVLGRLRDLGLRLSIDDFGTGYSSLAWLKRLPVHALKIDRSFVDGLGDDSNDSSIVAAIIGMARSMGLSTVAEGVERAEQLHLLRHLGCNQIQGYLLLRPQPVPEFMRWWESLGPDGIALSEHEHERRSIGH